MVEEDPSKWEVEPEENYLDYHELYRGINKLFWRHWPDHTKIHPNIFGQNSFKNDGLSTDWSKYRKPIDTFNGLRKPDLTENGILQTNVGKLKNLIKKFHFPLYIQHDPIRKKTKENPLNRAHTLICELTSSNYTKIRVKISKISNWVEEFDPSF